MNLEPDGEESDALMLKVAAPRESVVTLLEAAVSPAGSVMVISEAAMGDELPS
jgi:hypothetical protein